MRRVMKRYAVAAVVSLLFVTSACKKDAPPPPPPPPPPPTTAAPTVAPVSVATVTLGSAIAEDKKVVEAKEAFGTKDTIYASVDTAGAGPAKLRALWSFVKGDKTTKVDETVLEIDAPGPTVNEFHIVKPSGWPKGEYKVDIFLNDATEPAATRTFKVG
jgi:hypothetical protein